MKFEAFPVLLAFIYIIEEKARTQGIDGNWRNPIWRELRRYGVPADQFWEIHRVASK